MHLLPAHSQALRHRKAVPLAPPPLSGHMGLSPEEPRRENENSLLSPPPGPPPLLAVDLSPPTCSFQLNPVLWGEGWFCFQGRGAEVWRSSLLSCRSDHHPVPRAFPLATSCCLHLGDCPPSTSLPAISGAEEAVLVPACVCLERSLWIPRSDRSRSKGRRTPGTPLVLAVLHQMAQGKVAPLFE